VRRTEARSAGIDRPDGVARSLQVSRNKVEPSEASSRCNLLPKDWDSRRLAVRDEVVPRGPKVPLVSKPSAFACRAERLAGTGSGPHGTVVGPAGATQGVGPDSDPGEKMALRIPGKVSRYDILDAPFVHDAGGDGPRVDEGA
jgi:hypothetical protein